MIKMTSQGGYCVVMEELLNNKADVNAKVSLGNINLHLAAENRYTNAVRFSIKNFNPKRQPLIIPTSLEDIM